MRAQHCPCPAQGRGWHSSTAFWQRQVRRAAWQHAVTNRNHHPQTARRTKYHCFPAPDACMPHLLSRTKNSVYVFLPFWQQQTRAGALSVHRMRFARVTSHTETQSHLTLTLQISAAHAASPPCPAMAAGLRSQHEAQPRTAQRCPGVSQQRSPELRDSLPAAVRFRRRFQIKWKRRPRRPNPRGAPSPNPTRSPALSATATFSSAPRTSPHEDPRAARRAHTADGGGGNCPREGPRGSQPPRHTASERRAAGHRHTGVRGTARRTAAAGRGAADTCCRAPAAPHGGGARPQARPAAGAPAGAARGHSAEREARPTAPHGAAAPGALRALRDGRAPLGFT